MIKRDRRFQVFRRHFEAFRLHVDQAPDLINLLIFRNDLEICHPCSPIPYY